jgi:hypothetical protein
VLVALYPDLKMHPFQDIEVIYSGSQEKGLTPAGKSNYVWRSFSFKLFTQHIFTNPA